MNLAEQAGTAVVVLAAAAAATSLWRGADQHTGSVRRAYWWFALAAALWGAGVIVQDALAGPATSVPFPLTPADLPGLLALGAFVAGLVRLPGGRSEHAGERHPARGRGRVPGAVAAHLADGYVLASALLVLGGVLPFAVAAGRRGASPYLALLALSAADALAVGARVTGGYPAVGAEVLQVIGFGLLALVPWADGPRKARPGGAARRPRTGLDAATVVASLAATTAGLVLIVWALAGGSSARPVLALVGGTAVLALAARVLSLLRRVRAADGTWRYVESTVSRYRNPGGPDELLVTARDVSDQVELRRRVAHLTFHDGLTGLPNRAYVEDRARDALSLGHLHTRQQATRPGVAGVILIDLDSFTGVNDAAGHSAGDLLLAQVARRLRAAVPPQDTVGRWGGDEVV